MVDQEKLSKELIEIMTPHAEPHRAEKMQAYAKSKLPFLGLELPVLRDVTKAWRKSLKPTTHEEYAAYTLAIWSNATYHEERHTAIDYARLHKKFITLEQLDTYEQLITEGAWWDLVDPIASNLVSKAVLDASSDEGYQRMDEWIEADHMWLRRSALIFQLRAKDRTDQDRLFRYALKVADETEFFIRKATGWALRQYANYAPDDVEAFVHDNEDTFSNLTVREALKNIEKQKAKIKK